MKLKVTTKYMASSRTQSVYDCSVDKVTGWFEQRIEDA